MGTGFEGSLAPLYVLAVAGVMLVGAGPLGNILLARPDGSGWSPSRAWPKRL
jgi:hypothetical protein